MKQFISKRNEVFLREGLVYKKTNAPGAAALEAGVLRELRAGGAAVPAVLGCRDGVLVVEYLPGEPLPDVIERGGYDVELLAGALCEWFGGFYGAVSAGEARGDVNGRNFLVHDGMICGVDFEERVLGPKARDAGRLAAFIETYETCDTQRRMALSQAFMRGFAERFGCGMEEILAERDGEYEAMRLRRGALNLKNASLPTPRDACDAAAPLQGGS